MSAFDKVNEAKEAILVAQQAYQARKDAYDTAINGACEAIAANDIENAKKHLGSIGFEKSGEDPQAYAKMLRAAVRVPSAFTVPAELNIETWQFVTEHAPVQVAASMKGFFGEVLRKGSSTVLKDVLPFYNEAAENWQANWSAESLLQPPYSFAGKEDQLLERLKCVDILVDSGCPAARLSAVLHRIPQYAKETNEIGLSDKTLDAMSETYLKVAKLHAEENQTRFLLPEEYHLVPPENMKTARDAYFEMQREILGVSSEPTTRSKSPRP